MLNSTGVGYYAFMTKADTALAVEGLSRLIYEIRGQKVMLDRDLAAVYGAETRVLIQAVNGITGVSRAISSSNSQRKNGIL